MDREEQLISNIDIAFDRAEFYLKEARDNLSAGKTHESWALIDNILAELEEAEDWFEALKSNDESDD